MMTLEQAAAICRPDPRIRMASDATAIFYTIKNWDEKTKALSPDIRALVLGYLREAERLANSRLQLKN